MKKRKCPACGEKNNYEVSYCEYCAAKLSPTTSLGVSTPEPRGYTTNGHDDPISTPNSQLTQEQQALIRKLKSGKVVKIFFIVFFILQLLPVIFGAFFEVLLELLG